MSSPHLRERIAEKNISINCEKNMLPPFVPVKDSFVYVGLEITLIRILMQTFMSTTTHWLWDERRAGEKDMGWEGPRASHILSLMIRTTIGV